MKIKGHIWFETETGLQIGYGRVKLLECIDDLGSISEAAKKLEIPYRIAWGMIRSINENAPEPAVIKEEGGKAGGRSSLTDYGRKLVADYNQLDKKFKEFAEREGSNLSRRKE